MNVCTHVCIYIYVRMYVYICVCVTYMHIYKDKYQLIHMHLIPAIIVHTDIHI
jgi:hypothetical protein